MKLIIALFALITTTANAGTIVNKETGEQLSFSLSATELVIDGSSAGVGVKHIKSGSWNSELNEDQKPFVAGAIMPLSKRFIHSISPRHHKVHAGEVVAAYIVPGLNVVTVGVNALDLIALPVRLPLRWAKNARVQQDFKLIRTSIAGNESAAVSDARFKNLVKYLF